MNLCRVGPQTFYHVVVTNGPQMRPTLEFLFSIVFSPDAVVWELPLAAVRRWAHHSGWAPGPLVGLGRRGPGSASLPFSGGWSGFKANGAIKQDASLGRNPAMGTILDPGSNKELWEHRDIASRSYRQRQGSRMDRDIRSAWRSGTWAPGWGLGGLGSWVPFPGPHCCPVVSLTADHLANLCLPSLPSSPCFWSLALTPPSGPDDTFPERAWGSSKAPQPAGAGQTSPWWCDHINPTPFCVQGYGTSVMTQGP